MIWVHACIRFKPYKSCIYIVHTFSLSSILIVFSALVLQALLQLEDVPRGVTRQEINDMTDVYMFDRSMSRTLSTDEEKRCCVCLEEFLSGQMMRYVYAIIIREVAMMKCVHACAS